MEREKLGSRLGFILLSAGCAIGVGNVWKFPWMAGQYGGGAFVLVYLFFLLILGLPVMVIEFSLGRAAQKSPVRLYQQLEKPGQKWHLHGYAAMAGNYILMMFYTMVTGWIIRYFVDYMRGAFAGMDQAAVSAQFGDVLSDPLTMVLYSAFVVFIGFFVCSFKLQKGLERVTKYLMLALLALIIVMAIHSCTLTGAGEGLSFYLKPDLSKLNFDVVVAAMNQAFFTLSLGIGSMAIFGSYLGKERSLLGESINIICLDTFVAIVAGLIIFPACFTFGINPGAGPSLIFETLPVVFNNMAGGRFWGTLFFLFMSFAALSTVFAVYENIVACCMDLFGQSRKKACLFNGIVMFILVLPAIFGFNIWSGFHPLGGGTNIMDLEDFVVSNCLLPIGSLLFVAFATWKWGWGWKNFISEANAGRGLKLKNGLRIYIQFILPFLIFALFIVGIINFF